MGFEEKIHELWESAGRPTARVVASRCDVSHTAVADVVSGRRVPRWSTARGVIEAMGGDPEEFLAAWSEGQVGRSVTRVDSAKAALKRRREVDREIISIAAQIAENYGWLPLRDELKKLNSHIFTSDN